MKTQREQAQLENPTSDDKPVRMQENKTHPVQF